ncbi:MAG: MBL fold metallo-hydrolase [Chloroflexota bacterium]
MAGSANTGGGPRIARFVCGPLGNNVYLVVDPETRRALVIDPAMDSAAVLLEALRGRAPLPDASRESGTSGKPARPADTLGERGLTLELIVATHQHWDHVADAGPLAEETGAPIAAHRLEVGAMASPAHSLMFPDLQLPPARVSRELYEGDTVTLGAFAFRVLHTPGHTPGSICLHLQEHALLFSGDTLFAGSYGRYDLPGGDGRLLRDSLTRLASLPPETRVLPGHGEPTTIGGEDWLQRLGEGTSPPGPLPYKGRGNAGRALGRHRDTLPSR